MGRIPTNISDHIGNTPMVRLSRLEPEGVELYGKLEAYNPGGSVKDRIGIAMIEAAEAEGRIEPGRTTIVEATPANPEARRLGTGPEILKAMEDKVDIFVAGVGTGGTITGVGEAIKSVNPAAQVIAVEPAGSAVLSGRGPGPHRIQGIGAGFVPAVLDREIIDEVLAVSDDDAIDTAHLAAARE